MDHTPNVFVREKITIKKVENDREKKDARTVRSKVFIDEQNVPAELEYDEHDEEASTVHFIAYLGSRPVGAARLRQYGEGIGKAERVAVLKQTRGTGIGAALMKELESHAKDAGFQEIKLNAQLHAKNFYAQLGYKRIGDLFLDAGIEHIAMFKSLE